VFRADIRLVSVITDIAIFFTFGTIFPPLAVVGFVSICLHTLTMDVSLGRMLWLARYHYPALHRAHRLLKWKKENVDISNSTVLEEYLKIMNKECHGASQLLSKSLLSLSYLLAMFWSLFLFDTLGDAVGAKEAIWIIVLMGTFAGLVDLLNFMVTRRNKQTTGSSENNMTPSIDVDQEKGLELDMFGDPAVISSKSVDGNSHQTRGDDEVLNPIQ
jgi:hypothetical protein